MALLNVFVAAIVTALATGLGALPVGWIGIDRVRQFQPLLLGVTAGVMTAASVGLLVEPVRNAQYLPLSVGFIVGALFLLGTQRGLRHRGEHGQPLGKHLERSILVFAVLFVHSLPEGFAIGSAWGAKSANLGLFVFIAIAIQNIPEGTATAIPMAQAGFSKTRQFWAAVGTSLPQPVGAVAAFVLVEEINALLPWSLGFAAGAMLALVAADLLPEALTEDKDRGQVAIGALAAIGVMTLLALMLTGASI
ncbi:MAG: ZIP family metal transporter [Actinomycetes bacterium]